jgi:hypothetical protein
MVRGRVEWRRYEKSPARFLSNPPSPWWMRVEWLALSPRVKVFSDEELERTCPAAPKTKQPQGLTLT